LSSIRRAGCVASSTIAAARASSRLIGGGAGIECLVKAAEVSGGIDLAHQRLQVGIAEGRAVVMGQFAASRALLGRPLVSR
jgi:hypothetical protein